MGGGIGAVLGSFRRSGLHKTAAQAAHTGYQPGTFPAQGKALLVFLGRGFLSKRDGGDVFLHRAGIGTVI